LSSDRRIQKDLSSVISLLAPKVKRLAFQAIAAAAMFFRGVMRHHRPLFSGHRITFPGVLYAHSPLCPKNKAAVAVVKERDPDSSAQGSE
jgi:hypothetical protein